MFIMFFQGASAIHQFHSLPNIIQEVVSLIHIDKMFSFSFVIASKAENVPLTAKLHSSWENMKAVGSIKSCKNI